MHTKRPAPVPPWCCERSPRRPSTSSGPRVWARDQNVTALLGTPGESSKAAVHHHQNAPRRRNQQGVVFRSRPGQPLALVCMPRQWAVLRLGGCVSGNHMWCGRCLVMPGVKRRPIRWNQTGPCAAGQGHDSDQRPRHSPDRMLLLLLLQCRTCCTRSLCDCGKGLGLHTQSTSHLSASGGIRGLWTPQLTAALCAQDGGVMAWVVA